MSETLVQLERAKRVASAIEFRRMAMRLETTRNNPTGEITVTGESFVVHISESSFIQIVFPERTIELMRFGKVKAESRAETAPEHDANIPSPRSRPARRGAR
jgi:hypothetical protein